MKAQAPNVPREMVGRLDPEQIEELLSTELVARIGCHARGRTYVVPITYAYEAGSMYGHTREGMKLSMMRENPEVCVEVDRIEGPLRWRSVIAWGTFEELTGEAATRAMQILIDRYFGQQSSKAARGPLGPHRPGQVHPDALLYRIRLTEKTGRFEDEAP